MRIPRTRGPVGHRSPSCWRRAHGDGASPSASAGGSGGETACKVGVSWNNYEQPRWAATDQPNIEGAIEAGGGTYTEAFAKLDSHQQLTDVENLINEASTS